MKGRSKAKAEAGLQQVKRIKQIDAGSRFIGDQGDYGYSLNRR